jgi:HD superfamily phosphodiesterase
MDSILSKIQSFVIKSTLGRDPSHGYRHMETVAKNAELIMTNMDLTDQQRKWVLIVAWLHDVADHKYDHDGSLYLQVSKFVKDLDVDNANNITYCIGAISFSAEKRHGYLYYNDDLSENWVTVRNIVSDADKLEALGSGGIARCYQYAIETSPNVITRSQIQSYIWEHAQDKLLHLQNKYIHTEAGKKLAIPLHNYVIDWLLSIGITPNQLSPYQL